MSKKRPQLDPHRLFEAVGAIYQAFREIASSGGRFRYPTHLIGAPDQPECLCEFTRYEIEEAAAFLVRMQLLEPDPGQAN